MDPCVSTLTALQAAEARAASAERRLKAVIDALPEGVVLLDQDRRYVLWNERYRQIYHRSADLFAIGVRLTHQFRLSLSRPSRIRGRKPLPISKKQSHITHTCGLGKSLGKRDKSAVENAVQ